MDPAIVLFTCVRLIPRLFAIKQQIYIDIGICVNKVVRENDSFCPEMSEKINSAEK